MEREKTRKEIQAAASLSADPRKAESAGLAALGVVFVFTLNGIYVIVTQRSYEALTNLGF